MSYNVFWIDSLASSKQLKNKTTLFHPFFLNLSITSFVFFPHWLHSLLPSILMTMEPLECCPPTSESHHWGTLTLLLSQACNANSSSATSGLLFTNFLSKFFLSRVLKPCAYCQILCDFICLIAQLYSESTVWNDLPYIAIIIFLPHLNIRPQFFVMFPV